MIKDMVEHQVNMRNRFPGKNGVSSTMGPYSIVTGLPQPSVRDFKLEFGQFVQTYDHPDKTNNMRTRSTPVIALKSSGSQNGWNFMSLETEKRILRYKWTILPVPDSMIKRTHELADKLKLNKKATNAPITVEIENEDHDNEFSSDESTTVEDEHEDIEDKIGDNVSPITLQHTRNNNQLNGYLPPTSINQLTQAMCQITYQI